LIAIPALLVAAPAAVAQEVQPRIVAGSNAAPGELPYQVYLTSGPFECGGAILDKRHVVTAGHCAVDDGGFYPRVRAPGEIAVKHGSVDFSSLNDAPAVTTVSVDRRYLRSASDAYDAAVLTLASDLPTNANTAGVDLASPGEVNDALDGTPEAVVSGWGVTDPDTQDVSDTLQKATVPLVTDSACRTYYPELVDSAMLCAGSRSPFPSPRVEDACQGDSGGPLTVSGKLAGIVSFGEDCGRFPGVYTEVNDPGTRTLLEDDSQAPPPTAAGGPTVSGQARVGQTVTCNPRPSAGAVAMGYRWYAGTRSAALQIGTSRSIQVPSSAEGSAIFCDARLEGSESGFAYSTAGQVTAPVTGVAEGGVAPSPAAQQP